MQCIAYCTAATFEIQRLFQSLQTSGTAQMFRSVVHTQPKDEKGTKKDIFCFSFGVVIFWGFSEEEELAFLTELKAFEKDPLAKPEIDEFSFAYGDKMRIEEDE